MKASKIKKSIKKLVDKVETCKDINQVKLIQNKISVYLDAIDALALLKDVGGKIA